MVETSSENRFGVNLMALNIARTPRNGETETCELFNIKTELSDRSQPG